jgi:amino acid transporter
MIKLTPLILFMVIGAWYIVLHPAETASNFTPFAPFGFANFGISLVLIFWAYAGFEISTIPADVIENPGRVIPRAIMLGMAIVTVFYLATNAILFGIRASPQLAVDTAPLASATTTVLGSGSSFALIGGLIVGVGALISVAGSDESGMIGTSRLGYALAVDGLFPRIFAKVHPRFKTPYLAIIVQGVTALVASLVGNLGTLVAVSVFFLAIAYAATSASIIPLRKEGPKPKFYLRGGNLIPVLGVLFSIYLVTQCTFDQILIGGALLILGVPIYVRYTPKKELTELKEDLLSRDSIIERAFRQEEIFLAHTLLHVKYLYRRLMRLNQG